MPTTRRLANSYAYFETLAFSLLGVDLLYVDGKRRPRGPVNRSLLPTQISNSFDELLFGEMLDTFEVGELMQVTERFFTCFAVLRLWDEDGWLLLGPYLPERTDARTIEDILLGNGVPLTQSQAYKAFYARLTTLAQDKICVFFNCLCNTIHERTADIARLTEVAVSADPAAGTIEEEDKLRSYAEMIERRYDGERYFMECVAKGDYSAVESLLASFPNLERTPNQLRNEKNLLIIMNTLLRKTLESVHVHPLYIDQISTRFAVRIECLEASDSMITFRREMVRDYCEEVKRHSLAGFSPNVRRAITYIQFNLSGALSLEGIARVQNSNPSYLSTQFNREVGQSIPDYIADLRIAESCRLMRSTSASISQLATAVGFSDLAYFSRVFKKKMGVSPSEYRRATRP